MATIALLLAGVAAHGAEPDATRGGVYTQRELWAVGNLWNRTEAEWNAETTRHRSRVAEIEASSMSRQHKGYFLQREVRLHRAERQRLAQQRHQVQDVLITEANARAGKSRHATRPSKSGSASRERRSPVRMSSVNPKREREILSAWGCFRPLLAFR